MKKWMFIFKIGLFFAVIFLISRSLDFGKFWSLTESLPWYLFVAGPAIVLLQAQIMAFRWKRVTGFFAHAQLSSYDSLTHILISFFFSQGLPASIGGDAARIWLLKEQDCTVRAGMRAVVVDRFWGLLSLVALTCCGLLVLASTQDQIYNWHGVIIAAAVLTAGIIIGTIGWPISLLKYCNELTAQYVPFAASTVDSLTRLKRNFDRYNRNRGRFALTFAESISIHLLGLLLAALPFLAGPEPASLIAFFAVIPPALLISYLPISIAGWGVREGALIVSLGLIGISLENALLISLFIGLTVLLVSLIGGILWFVSSTRKSARPALTSQEPYSARDQ